MSRPYPDEPVSPFDPPPSSFADGEGREIELVAVDHAASAIEGEPAPAEDAYEALVEMYVGFDPADRAQGIPPSTESAIREWLDTLLDSGHDTLAWHDSRCVGHATLVEDDEETSELAIFVDSAYQHAGIGSRLLEALLGHAQEMGVERVWLTVERWNGAAIAVYHKVGFETCNTESFELEMSIRLQ